MYLWHFPFPYFDKRIGDYTTHKAVVCAKTLIEARKYLVEKFAKSSLAVLIPSVDFMEPQMLRADKNDNPGFKKFLRKKTPA